MNYHLPAATVLYRVTSWDRKKWPDDVVSGNGAKYRHGRYHVANQRTVYASDDPLVPITEMAYYLADELQELLGTDPYHGRRYRANFPLARPFRLWSFAITAPLNLVDLEHGTASLSFGHSRHILLNPCREHRDPTRMWNTQAVSNQVRLLTTPSTPDGIQVPSVRTPRQGPYQPHQQAIFVDSRPLTASRAGLWKLVIEFLESSGNPVTPNSIDIDWATPRFTLTRPRTGAPVGPVPAFPLRPGAVPFLPNQPYSIPINYA